VDEVGAGCAVGLGEGGLVAWAAGRVLCGWEGFAATPWTSWCDGGVDEVASEEERLEAS
jgi:hypothetical protein